MTQHERFAIAYDSDGLPGYETGWGFSVIVVARQHKVLFDCGWDGPMLRRNLKQLGVTFGEIDRVVLSHEHWDHISGLATVLWEHPESEQVEVFVPASFSGNLKGEISKRAVLREVTGPQEVVPGVLSTGELGDDLKEQSLLIVDGEGCVVITGCAHPGVGRILRRASEQSKPRWLVGGFHDARAQDIPRGLERIVMCHCTRHKTAIAKAFGEAASTGGAGKEFSLFDSPGSTVGVDAKH